MLLLFCREFRRFVEFLVPEIEPDVDRDLNEVQNIEEECQVEQKSGFSAYRLKNLPRNTAGITDKQEYFKEKTLSLRRSRNDGFSD